MVSLVALLLTACSGGTTAAPEPRAGASEPAAASVPPAASTTISTPAASQPPSAGGPDLSYAVLDTKMEGESPIRRTPVFTGAPQTRLEGGELWAPATAVVHVLAPEAMVTFEDGRLKIDGRPVTVPARLENGQPWAAVVPLARHFGAYARVHQPDGSVVIWPREALLWLRDHGDQQAAVLREAKAAGLLGSDR